MKIQIGKYIIEVSFRIYEVNLKGCKNKKFREAHRQIEEEGLYACDENGYVDRLPPVKRFKTLTGLYLKESKDEVERYLINKYGKEMW